MRRVHLIVFLALALMLANSFAQAEEAGAVIRKGSKVSFDYTLMADGETVDSSQESGAFHYVSGEGGIIPELDRQIEGLQAGSRKEIILSPAEAYGEINPDAFREVPRNELPGDIEPQAGMMLQVMNPEGDGMPVRISEVKEDVVVLDFNHPLAGKTLVFDIKIISVE